MPLPNCENPRKGRDFEVAVACALEKKFGVPFAMRKIPIGNPPKGHNFDLVSTDGSIVAECKNYSWTETGNVPSAKMGFVNEAVFYLQHLPGEVELHVILRKDVSERRKETLAEYYYRTNRHLLGKVGVSELDMATGELRSISGEDYS